MTDQLLRAPIDCHEGVVERFLSRNPETKTIVRDAPIDSLVEAMRATRMSAEALAELAKALPSDRTLTPEAAALKLRSGGIKIAEAAALRLDAARAKVAAEIERVEASIAAPPKPMDSHLASEIRARLASMPADKRSEALASCDEITLAAVLNAPAYLAGLKPVEHAMKRHEWQTNRFPAETERLARLRKALEAAERGGRAFVAFVRNTVESPSIALAEATAERSRQAQEQAARVAAE